MLSCGVVSGSRVSSVTLQLGEVSGVVPHYLEDAWRWASNKNRACLHRVRRQIVVKRQIKGQADPQGDEKQLRSQYRNAEGDQNRPHAFDL